MSMPDGMKKTLMDKIHKLEKEIFDLRVKLEKKESDIREAKSKLFKGYFIILDKFFVCFYIFNFFDRKNLMHPTVSLIREASLLLP